MADYIVINKYFNYQQGICIFPVMAGETRTLEFIKSVLDSHIIDDYLKKGTFTLHLDPVQTTQDPVQDPVDPDPIDNTQDPVQTTQDPVQDPVDPDPIDNTQDPMQDPVDPQPIDNTQDPVQTTTELMYKTTEALVTPEGAKIKKGTIMTEKQILEAGLDFQKLLAEDKLLEVKITK